MDLEVTYERATGKSSYNTKKDCFREGYVLWLEEKVEDLYDLAYNTCPLHKREEFNNILDS